jgi:hypothetical protein
VKNPDILAPSTGVFDEIRRVSQVLPGFNAI